MKEKFIDELDEWIKLVSTPEWLQFVALLRPHKVWLQEQVNINLKQHNDRAAGEYRARMEEVGIILGKVETRINELKFNKKGGQKDNG